MMFKSRIFEEPVLEFGDGGQSPDPRQGLREYGPLQPKAGDLVRIGVIGTEDTVEGFSEFIEEVADGIESGNEKLINLNPDFPGLSNQNPFRCRFEVQSDATVLVSKRQINEIRKIAKHEDAVRTAVDLMAAQIAAIAESGAKPDVIVLALPLLLIEKVVNAKSDPEEEAAEEDAGDEPLNFRDLLKARVLTSMFLVRSSGQIPGTTRRSFPER
ncbi:argonaute/piwi family protein [Rhizobium bangladeshense]|uniref:hypothetical protein n=1 Tax=Rhizobium bangladeshense TaxID=1138189 RepID=UPI0028C381CC|nr:hypothetical protein [Rhizobium bangladeshense]